MVYNSHSSWHSQMAWTVFGGITVVVLFSILHLCISVPSVTAYVPPPTEELLFPPEAAQRYAHSVPGSHFGYSVATYVGQSQSFCLVGAPRGRRETLGDISDERSASSPERSPPTGLVYRIDLDPNIPYCSIVPIATTDEVRRELGTPTPGISQWLGGTVAAANNAMDGIQLGCDPRYLYSPEPINQTESDGNIIQPRTYIGTGQCALYTGASMQYTSVDACASQEEGACLAGFSADVEAGHQFGEAFVALGLPGSYLTEGNVFLGHYRGRELINAMRLKSSPQDLKHLGFNLGFAVLLTKLVREPEISIKQAIGSDMDRSTEVNQNVPRFNSWNVLASSSMWFDNDYRGIVMILDQALDIGGVTYLKDQWGHVGSFFGYSLATADLDGNGILDIIIGAPYYTGLRDGDTVGPVDDRSSADVRSNKRRDATGQGVPGTGTYQETRKTWGRLAPDVGRAYVFYGFLTNSTEMKVVTGSVTKPDYLSHPPALLTGLNANGGRFGHVVVNLGDVDGDGTEDVAISCPYCEDPEGRSDRGAVFVYLGKKHAMLADEPYQIIWPGDLPRASPLTTCGDYGLDTPAPRPFLSFGWSLSAGTDLDGNNAPDMVVGDFESDQVVLIRARNTVWFDSPEWELPLIRTLPWSGPNQTDCGAECRFYVQLTVAVHGKDPFLQHHTTNLKLHVTVDTDALTENLVFKRLTGINLADPSGRAIIGILDTLVPLTVKMDDVSGQNRMTLLSLTLEPQSSRVRTMLWKPVVINATVSPVYDEMPHVTDSKRTPSWTLHPFLGNRHFVSRALQFANPVCGSDNICHADLQVRLVDTSDGPSDNLVIYFRERITQRNLTVGIGNLGENAYAAQLRMTFPHQISFSIPPELVCQSKLLHDIQATEILCGLGDPLGYTGGTLKPFIFQLNTAGAFRDLDEPLNDEPDGNTTQPMEQDSSPDQGGYVRDRRSPKESPPIKDSLTITAEVLSGNEDADVRDNKATITYRLQLAARIELSSSSLDRTTIDSRNFTVQLYEMQRVHPETLGPEIKHIYLVSNEGPSPVEHLWVNVSIPIQTREGEHLVYLLDRIRHQADDGGPPLVANMAPEVISAEGHVRGTCYTPDWALNPLRLNAVHRGLPDRQTGRKNVDSSNNDESVLRLHRAARSVSRSSFNPSDSLVDNGSLSKTDIDSEGSAVRNARSILPGVRKRQQEIVRCDQELSGLGIPICATVHCRIDHLSRGDAVRVVLRGYVWADTFFRHKISDLAIVSEARSTLLPIAFGIPVSGNLTIQPLAISQNFVFHGIKIPLFREIPLWPIILGCVLGATLLAVIIFAMWKCGFFRRKRWYSTANATTNSVTAIGPTDL